MLWKHSCLQERGETQWMYINVLFENSELQVRAAKQSRLWQDCIAVAAPGMAVAMSARGMSALQPFLSIVRRMLHLAQVPFPKADSGHVMEGGRHSPQFVPDRGSMVLCPSCYCFTNTLSTEVISSIAMHRVLISKTLDGYFWAFLAGTGRQPWPGLPLGHAAPAVLLWRQWRVAAAD